VIGNLFDDLLLKGHGVWVKHPHIPEEYNPLTGKMEAGEMKRVFAPSEVPDGVNPIHINPYTSDMESGMFKRWGESPDHPSEQDAHGKPLRFINRDVLSSLVDEYLRALVKAGKIDPRNSAAMELKKVDLRKMLNRGAKLHNSNKTLLDKNRYPEKGVWVNPDSKDGQHPDFLKHIWTPRFQHLAKHQNYMNGTWVLKPRKNKDGTSDMDTHPSKVLLRNEKGDYITGAKSDGLHEHHGEMTEGLYFGALPETNYLFKQEYPDVELTSQLNMGNIIEPGAVVSAHHSDGTRSTVVERALKQNPVTHGRGGVSPRNAKHPPVGFEQALLSLHPILFTPQGGRSGRSDDQQKFAHWFLSKKGQIQTNPHDVVNFAKSPVCQMLYHSYKGQSSDKGGQTPAQSTIIRQMRQHMASGLGIPMGEYEGMTGDDKRKFSVHNTNVKHMSINDSEFFGRMKRARTTMKKLLYYSMRYNENPELDKGLAAQAGMSNFNAGQLVKTSVRSALRGIPTVGPESYNWLDETNVPKEEMVRPAAPKEGISPYVNDSAPSGAVTGGGGQSLSSPLAHITPPAAQPSESPYAGLFGINSSGKKSVDTLHDLMESLQSADARMDNLVLKQLPEFRRFNLFNNQDCDLLCDTFGLQQRDLLFIQEGVGDWTSIAKELNVDPRVVKAVKVALRW